MMAIKKVLMGLQDTVQHAVREDIEQVKSSVRLSYSKLEEDIEGLREDLNGMRSSQPVGE